MKAVILAIFIVLSSAVSMAAEDPAPAPDYPVLAKPEDARPLVKTHDDQIRKVIDHFHMVTRDGRIIELAGLEVPAGLQPQAMDTLKTLFAKQNLQDAILYQTPRTDLGRVNRLGQDLAHLVRKDGSVWVQGALLSLGLARAWPTAANPELAEKMYGIEDAARKAGLGLWSKDSREKILTPADRMDPMDRFVIVEGKVRKIATVNNVTYLNFGNDWSRDFTVGIPAGVRKAMNRQKINVLQLNGENVRVRGWMRYYNGPYIELEHPVLLQRVIKEDAEKQ